MRTLALVLGLLCPGSAFAQPEPVTYTVSTESDLRTALTSVVAGDKIVLASNITLTSGDLPSVSTDITIDGGGHTLSGNSQYRGLIVAGFSDGVTQPIAVTIRDLVISDTVAQGGKGGDGGAGGGGGGGLGGALLVASQADVVLFNVSVSRSAARGGSGGNVIEGSEQGGGGGGLGGNGGRGGAAGDLVGGGGGGVGTGADGGFSSDGGAGVLIGGVSGGSGGSTASGGVSGGGGGSDGAGSGGGGQSGNSGGSGTAGSGGYGGGGAGGAQFSSGGSGGFGGGGGGGGGIGGYGGGGGGNITAEFSGAPSQFGGGIGGINATAGGGGGAGLGGAIFVDSGGSLTIAGKLTIDGGAVSGGAGGTEAQSGSAFGAGMFFGGFGQVRFVSEAGDVQTVADSIGDEFGSSGIGDRGFVSVSKVGEGTLVLSGDNTYAGGTDIRGGTVSVSSASNLGSGVVEITANGRLAITGSGTFGQDVRLANFLPLTEGFDAPAAAPTPVIEVAAGQDVTLAGVVSDNVVFDFIVPGTLTLTGGGTLRLTNTNFYTGGTNVIGNSELYVNFDAALGDTTGNVALGDATTHGTLGIGGTTLTTDRLFTLNAGGGTIDTEGSATATLNGIISGEGSLTKAGTGVLTLTASNTYSGGTIVEDGLLRAQAVDAFGTGALRVDSPGSVAINGFDQTVGSLAGGGKIILDAATLTTGGDNTTSTYSGALSGTGTLVKNGTGTQFLTGANSYSGGTTVNAGTLAGTTDGLQGSIVNNSAVTFEQKTNGTYSGVMSGSGSLTKIGGGTVTLTGANTYGGGTNVLGGVLAGSTTSLQGNIAVSNATVRFDQNFDATYAGDFTGAGVLAKTGTGTLTLTGTNNYTGTTLINGGTLVGSTTSIGGDVVDNAQLVFNQAADGTFTGGITGTGSVTKTGAGTLTLTGTSSYTGGTTIAAGALAGTTQSLQGNIANNAVLRFDQLFDGIFSGAISGTGSLTKTGAGVVTLDGTNTYSGGTTVSGGGLMGTTSSLQGTIVNNAQVIFNQDTDGAYAGTMTGTGSLVKAGTGTLTLTGTTLYTGGTVISGGTLQADTTKLQGPVINDARLVFNQLTDGIFAGSIVGSGSVVKSGAGTLTLTGNAFYTGGTVISGGTLAGSTNNIQGSIQNNGALRFDQTFNGTFAGSMSGSGSFTKTGGGTLFLDGNNSYTGGTSVLGGALVGTTSSLQGAIVNNALVVFGQNSNGTYAGAMSGTGSLAKTGAGTLTLSGANSYTGGTSIVGGAVAIASDTNLGAASGGVSLGDAATAGTLSFTSSLSSLRNFSLGAAGGVFDATTGTVTLFGNIGGTGGLTKTGEGVLVLAGTSSFTGPTVVGGGTLRAGSGNAFGSQALLVGAGATADLNGFSQSVGALGGSGNILLGAGTLTTGADGSSGAFSGSIAGTGSLVKTGGGTLVLTGANSYSGGTSVFGGALAGNTTSLQGNILNNGLVQFDQSNNGTYAGSMSGSGVLAKTGGGVLTLTGNNTYSGGTVINGGSIIGTASSLRGAIINNAQLTFGGNTDGAFVGSIGGTGSLLKTGTGTLTLTGAQPLTGLFSVAQGTLALNGAYGGSIDVSTGAALRASGLIAGSLNLAGSLFAVPTGTAFAPAGLAGGTTDAVSGDRLEGPSFLTIGQNFTALNGSLLDFAIGPGVNPTILVGGTAAFNGARFNITAPSIGNARSTSFLALSTLNGLSLNNSQITTGDANVIPILKQDRNSLFVTLINLNPPLRGVASDSTGAVADALDRSKLGLDGDGAFVIRELTALDDESLRNALEQIAGQLQASVLQTAILDAESVTDLIRDQLSTRELEDGEDFRWWGEAACQRADFKATNTARGGDAQVCAGAGGVDRRLSEKWTVGGGGSFTGGNMSIGSMGSGDYAAPRAFGYAGFKPKNFGFRGGLSGARSNYETQRRIQFQALLPIELGGLPLSEGVDREAKAEQKGTTRDEWGEIHDSRKLGGYTLEGMLGIRHARISRGSFTEAGAIALSLIGEDEILNLTQTDVKFNAFRREGSFRPFLNLYYRHELAEGATEAQVEFSGLPNSEFIVQGINIPAHSYSAKAGATFATILGQATFTYEYKHAPGQRRQTAGFRIRFK